MIVTKVNLAPGMRQGWILDWWNGYTSILKLLFGYGFFLFFVGPIISIWASTDLDNYCKGKPDEDVSIGMSLLQDIYVASAH